MGSGAAPLPQSALISCCGSRTFPTLTHVQPPLLGYLMIFPIYSPKGDTALLGRLAKDIKPIPCSSAVAAASPAASRSPTETRTAKHLFGGLCPFPALGIGSQTQMMLCWVWMQWDSVLWVCCWCWGWIILAAEVASAGPWGAAWCQPGHN